MLFELGEMWELTGLSNYFSKIPVQDPNVPNVPVRWGFWLSLPSPVVVVALKTERKNPSVVTDGAVASREAVQLWAVPPSSSSSPLPLFSLFRRLPIFLLYLLSQNMRSREEVTVGFWVPSFGWDASGMSPEGAGERTLGFSRVLLGEKPRAIKCPTQGVGITPCVQDRKTPYGGRRERSRGYKVLGPDIPTHVPTDSRHRADVLDIILIHVEVIYDMVTQHLPILATVEVWARHLPPQTTRKRTDWTAFQVSLKTLHLGFSFAAVYTVVNQLVNKIRRAQSITPTLLPISTSRRRDLPLHIKPEPAATSPLLQKHYAHVKERVRKFMATPPLPFQYLFLSPAELHKIVLHLPKKKAPEPNGISIAALRHLPRRAKAAMNREQYGFRTGHSTLLQQIRVLPYLASKKNCGRHTMAVLLDMEKAFHKVWYNGLLHKLLDTSLPPALTRVTSFLYQRNFCVTVNEALSVPRLIRAGVPQGSCLCPSLYATYTVDIPTL
ncbi:Probable RNA-directed DNA polymerase from transposon BS [Eumeta japonica]|uniref:Probable RNA-directed DNA polymerase from transposon BS n=1 Tax=Eumeta variegata TaxID=151549 RepID=A0A4C1XI24_EUMVA|nr:Probable RNA-directed DNA polymerase from transposon BS [Eumeta japonica]